MVPFQNSDNKVLIMHQYQLSAIRVLSDAYYINNIGKSCFNADVQIIRY